MAARFVNIDHNTPLLLPPDLRDWVRKDHLVHFVMDAVEQIDVQAARVNEGGTGSAQYPPRMMLALLIYSYATGIFGSRQIERSTYESVATRLLCADTHPDHDTICAFRRENRALLGAAFAQVLEMAARCQVLKVGGITVAIDGTKVLANASKHAAVSYERAGEQMRELELEIEELVKKAEKADSAPLEDGLSIPAEVQRRAERKAKLAQARAEIEARAYARAVDLSEAEVGAAVRKELEDDEYGSRPLYEAYEPTDPARLPTARLTWTLVIVTLLLASAYGVWRFLSVEPDEALIAAQNRAADESEAPQSDAAPATATKANAVAANAPVVLTGLAEVWIGFDDATGKTENWRTLEAGEVYQVPPAYIEQFTLRTSIPQALKVTVGGRDVGSIGPASTLVKGVSLKPVDLVAHTQGGAAATPAGPRPKG